MVEGTNILRIDFDELPLWIFRGADENQLGARVVEKLRRVVRQEPSAGEFLLELPGELGGVLRRSSNNVPPPVRALQSLAPGLETRSNSRFLKTHLQAAWSR